MIRLKVPRYKIAHRKQIVNALNLLERGGHERLEIDRRWSSKAITATVFGYAMIRDSEDAEELADKTASKNATQAELMPDDAPEPGVKHHSEYEGGAPLPKSTRNNPRMLHTD